MTSLSAGHPVTPCHSSWLSNMQTQVRVRNGGPYTEPLATTPVLPVQVQPLAASQDLLPAGSVGRRAPYTYLQV